MEPRQTHEILVNDALAAMPGASASAKAGPSEDPKGRLLERSKLVSDALTGSNMPMS